MGKSTRDGTNREKVHKEIENIEDLVKRKGRSCYDVRFEKLSKF